MKTNFLQLTSVIGFALLLAGCAQQQQQGKYTPAPAAVSTPAQPSPPPPAGSVSGYFPSGEANGSGLMILKSAPSQVLAGQPYQYTYLVTNLTDATLENVVVNDRVSSDFTASDSDPKAASMSDGIATWNLGNLGPKEAKTITVKGSSPDEGVVTTCGWATYNPVACQDIHVVKANIALTKTAPADVLICDSIPATIDVKNTGSSPLTGVQVTDTLPSGLASDGKSSLTFDVGNLAPGESKEFNYKATASATGKMVNNASVTTTEGVTAQASATTTVHQPVLAITCKAPDQQFMGRKFDVCYTVSNTGDAPATGAKLEVAVPAGLTVASTTAGGQITTGKIDWDLGSIDVNGSQNVCATFTGSAAGSFEFAGTASGTCATAVSTSCQTKVVGIAAILLEKSDDPDPVAVGDTTTYTVKVTNQGTADDSNVQVVVTVAPELVPVSTSDGTINGQIVTLPLVPTLQAKQAVTYKIIAKGVTPGDGHTKFTLSSSVLTSPIMAEESTTVY